MDLAHGGPMFKLFETRLLASLIAVGSLLGALVGVCTMNRCDER
ncbi:MAG: hypothetical protein ACXVX9_15230 [Mycobacteriaceae bacterium]